MTFNTNLKPIFLIQKKKIITKIGNIGYQALGREEGPTGGDNVPSLVSMNYKKL